MKGFSNMSRKLLISTMSYVCAPSGDDPCGWTGFGKEADGVECKQQSAFGGDLLSLWLLFISHYALYVCPRPAPKMTVSVCHNFSLGGLVCQSPRTECSLCCKQGHLDKVQLSPG